MKAIAVYPGKADSAHIRRVKRPRIKDNEVLVKTLYAGVCGTDLEINQGLYGESPKGCNYLIMGHESVGEIVKSGIHALPTHRQLSDKLYAVRTVRRPCGNCENCNSGANDMCLTGNFNEVGIKGIHGVMAEYYADSLDNLVIAPENLKEIAVLIEPMSVVAKGTRHTDMIQERHAWNPKKALIMGAGPIGLLETMILRLSDIETYVMARSPSGNLKSQIAETAGAKYFSSKLLTMEQVKKKVGGNIDFIMDASGNAEKAFEAMEILGTNGVLCLTSITGGSKSISLDANKINLEFVLGNKCVFGTVNANKKDYEEGIKYFGMMATKWPFLLEKLITGRFKPEDFSKAFEKSSDTIKSVIEF